MDIQVVLIDLIPEETLQKMSTLTRGRTDQMLEVIGQQEVSYWIYGQCEPGLYLLKLFADLHLLLLNFLSQQTLGTRRAPASIKP